MWTKNKLASMVAVGAILGTAPVAAEVFSGRGTAMAGAGVAGGDYTYSALINPATATNFKENDDFATTFDFGLIANNENEFLDTSEDLTDFIEELDGYTANQSDADYILSQLEILDDSRLTLDAGAQLTIAVPNSLASGVLFVRQSAFIATDVQLADSDVALLENFGEQLFDENDLQTAAGAFGYSMQEIGFAAARQFTFGGYQVSLGATPKHQRVETIEYIETIAGFDSDDFEADDYTLEHTNFNIDFGATINWGELQGGISLRNALAQEYETVQGGVDIRLDPQLTAGAGYTGEIFTVLADLDLNSVELFDGAGAVQIARLGAEVDLFDWAQLRVGYRHDLKGTYDGALTAGFGFSPFDVVHFHLSAIKSSDDTLGAALQFGLEL
ncbi:conjugal transfer protein TraF [Microbulbifer sp. CAU 1566]|uniref:conjugal transfer protein TraF n=1 Tax=Microbulbifer sp. CAU 1566 TaxID=2933269 RepID=UPI0020047D56|nr:conjugal transfer protein TraF [Microbulbifer sp. CAU 1566]MCK7597980.1 conjugal transfer protein TraF [Microbulbifer sp. CAU 1566]